MQKAKRLYEGKKRVEKRKEGSDNLLALGLQMCPRKEHGRCYDLFLIRVIHNI
jgi:hypothetical protein